MLMCFPSYSQYALSRECVDSEAHFRSKCRNSIGVSFAQLSRRYCAIMGLSCRMSEAKRTACLVTGSTSDSIDLTMDSSNLAWSTEAWKILSISAASSLSFYLRTSLWSPASSSGVPCCWGCSICEQGLKSISLTLLRASWYSTLAFRLLGSTLLMWQREVSVSRLLALCFSSFWTSVLVAGRWRYGSSRAKMASLKNCAAFNLRLCSFFTRSYPNYRQLSTIFTQVVLGSASCLQSDSVLQSLEAWKCLLSSSLACLLIDLASGRARSQRKPRSLSTSINMLSSRCGKACSSPPSDSIICCTCSSSCRSGTLAASSGSYLAMVMACTSRTFLQGWYF